MEGQVHKLMELVLAFLKQAKLISPQTHPKFVNKMTVLNLQDSFRAKVGNGGYGADMLGAVFSRTSCLLSLIHAKKLLMTHGYESFSEYITGFFDLTKKEKSKSQLVRQLKNSPEYKEFETALEEG